MTPFARRLLSFRACTRNRRVAPKPPSPITPLTSAAWRRRVFCKTGSAAMPFSCWIGQHLSGFLRYPDREPITRSSQRFTFLLRHEGVVPKKSRPRRCRLQEGLAAVRHRFSVDPSEARGCPATIVATGRTGSRTAGIAPGRIGSNQVSLPRQALPGRPLSAEHGRRRTSRSRCIRLRPWRECRPPSVHRRQARRRLATKCILSTIAVPRPSAGMRRFWFRPTPSWSAPTANGTCLRPRCKEQRSC